MTIPKYETGSMASWGVGIHKTYGDGKSSGLKVIMIFHDQSRQLEHWPRVRRCPRIQHCLYLREEFATHHHSLSDIVGDKLVRDIRTLD